MEKPQPFCPVCGMSTSFSQLRAHELANHPEFYGPFEQARRRILRGFYAVVVPALAVWATLTLVVVWIGWLRTWSVWGWTLYFVGGPALIAALGSVYSRTTHRPDLRQLSLRPVPCVLCRTSMPSKEQREHAKAVHPEAYRYDRIIMGVSRGFGVLLLVTLFVGQVLVGSHSISYFGSFLLLAAVGLIGILLLFLLRRFSLPKVLAMQELNFAASRRGPVPNTPEVPAEGGAKRP